MACLGAGANGYEPNYYYGPDNNIINSIMNTIITPTNIDIYTTRLDLTTKIGKSKAEYGEGFSRKYQECL
jgi:hypothetical protein